MNRLPACRVCLARNTRLCSIMDGQLRDIYEKLVEVSLINDDVLPTSVCLWCFSKMKEILQFRDISQKSNQILQQMLNSGLEPSLNSLDIMVRNQSGSSTVGTSDIDKTTTCPAPEEVLIKREPVQSETDLDGKSDRNEGPGVSENGKNTFITSDIVQIKIEPEIDFEAMSEDQNEDYSEDVPPYKEGSSDTEQGATEVNVEFTPKDTVDNNSEYAGVAAAVQREVQNFLEIEVSGSRIDENKDKITIPKQTKKIKPRGYTEKKKPHICDECDKKFTRKEYLIIHKRVHSGERPYTCTTCKKTFIQSGDLTKHLRVHTKEKPYKCDTCEKCFSSSSALVIHKRIHTGEKPYTCPYCEKGFYRNADLIPHLRVHTKERPYKCDVCEKCFGDRSTLTKHKKTHSDEKPYACSSCDKTFVLYNNLSRHMKVHTQERTFKCDVCDKGFIQITDLTRHLRTHSGERPFPCTYCDKRFSLNCDLVRHIRLHTNERPYECDVCEKSFNRKSHLTRHYKTHLPSEFDDEPIPDGFEEPEPDEDEDEPIPDQYRTPVEVAIKEEIEEPPIKEEPGEDGPPLSPPVSPQN